LLEPGSYPRSAQVHQAQLKSRGKLVIAEESGHHMPADDPDLVIESVQSILAER
jgi:hypothetical protein